MSKVKYNYDYPIQREIASKLLSDDKVRMSEVSGLSSFMVQAWCKGTRKNEKLMELALQYAEINKRCGHLKDTLSF